MFDAFCIFFCFAEFNMLNFFFLWLYILTDIKSGVFVLMLLTCVTKALLKATGVISEDRETKLETRQDV